VVAETVTATRNNDECVSYVKVGKLVGAASVIGPCALLISDLPIIAATVLPCVTLVVFIVISPNHITLCFYLIHCFPFHFNFSPLFFMQSPFTTLIKSLDFVQQKKK